MLLRVVNNKCVSPYGSGRFYTPEVRRQAQTIGVIPRGTSQTLDKIFLSNSAALYPIIIRKRTQQIFTVLY